MELIEIKNMENTHFRGWNNCKKLINNNRYIHNFVTFVRGMEEKKKQCLTFLIECLTLKAIQINKIA